MKKEIPEVLLVMYVEESQGVSIRDILSRRDPHGYYVIPIKTEAVNTSMNILRKPGIILIEYGDLALVKTRSRSMAEKLTRYFARRNLLAEDI